MSLHDVWELSFSFFRGKAVCVEPAEENLSTDAGLLVLRQFDEQRSVHLGLRGATGRFAARSHPFQTGDGPQPRVWHSGRLRRSERHHDALRSDVIFKLLDRLPEDSDLASQPTLSRFENSISTSTIHGA